MDENLIARFWSRVEKTDGCWLWRGNRNRHGYGLFSNPYGSRLAHRVAWRIVTGEFPSKNLCHRCDNPTCVNPGHCFEGTQADNVADMMAKGRRVQGNARGTEVRCAKLNPELVREARAAHALGESTVSLARRFGVRQCTMWQVVNFETWRHVL